MSSVLVYAGLLAAALGALVALFPIRRLGLGRRLGATALLAGAVALAAGLLMPPRRETPAAERQHMDRFLPVYDVNEVNSIRIHATPARIDEAIRTTRAGEVRLLAPLFWLRSLPGRLAGAGGEVPESDEILVPAAGQRRRARAVPSLLEVHPPGERGAAAFLAPGGQAARGGAALTHFEPRCYGRRHLERRHRHAHGSCRLALDLARSRGAWSGARSGPLTARS